MTCSNRIVSSKIIVRVKARFLISSEFLTVLKISKSTWNFTGVTILKGGLYWKVRKSDKVFGKHMVLKNGMISFLEYFPEGFRLVTTVKWHNLFGLGKYRHL